MGTSTAARLPLTVIIPARNEERNIAQCLDSVSWADQVFVVDSRSSDRTRELSEARSATVVDFHYDGGWPKKKNWAIRNLPIRNEWIFILDADERIDEDLREEIGKAMEVPGINGYYVRWKFIFLGRWMKHCWRHGWMLRLFRKGSGEYEDLGMRNEGGWDNEVHENIVVEGRTAKLHNWLIHESNESLSYWIRKQNEFSDWNAVRRHAQLREPLPSWRSLLSHDPLERRRFLKALYLRLPCKPLLMFLYLYIVRLGILDGKEGYYFCRCVRFTSSIPRPSATNCIS